MDKLVLLFQNNKGYVLAGGVLLLAIIPLVILSSSANKEQEVAPISQPTITQAPSLESELKDLDKGETQHAEEQAAIQRSYPWFNELPIQEKDYFVYFDAEKNTFVGLLYPKTASTVSIEQQAETMKVDAQTKLEAKGILWQNYHFEWKIIPE